MASPGEQLGIDGYATMRPPTYIERVVTNPQEFEKRRRLLAEERLRGPVKKVPIIGYVAASGAEVQHFVIDEEVRPEVSDNV